MNSLFINVGYWPFRGGGQLYVQAIAERLVADGHRVTVYTTDAGHTDHLWLGTLPCGRPEYEVLEGVEVYRFKIRRMLPAPYAYYALRRLAVTASQLRLGNGLLWRLARWTPWVPGLERALRERNACDDYVHAWSIPFESLMYAGFQYARARQIPYIATPFVHLGEPGSNRVKKFYTMKHQLQLLARSDAVVAMTELEQTYLNAAGVRAERLGVVGPGVDLDGLLGGEGARFRTKYRVWRPFVFYLGTVAFEKGAVHTLQAMQRLWDRRLDADLVVAGPVMQHFRRFFKRLPEPARARCHLLGEISDQDKRDMLDAGMAMVLPSRTESFGIAYLEAWTYGKPVIGARAGGVPALVRDGENGFLVPFGDVKTLSARIKDLIADPALRRRMGETGYRRVINGYTWNHSYASLLRVYETLLTNSVGENEQICEELD